jgi:hypothetical protein
LKKSTPTNDQSKNASRSLQQTFSLNLAADVNSCSDNIAVGQEEPELQMQQHFPPPNNMLEIP